MNKDNFFKEYHTYACLPFVELGDQEVMQMGPVLFCSSSKISELLSSTEKKEFDTYLETVGHIKVTGKLAESPEQFTYVQRLNPRATTCVAMHPEIKEEDYDALLIDALYLLYFVSTLRNLYLDRDTHPVRVFRKLIPASLAFIHNKTNWAHAHIYDIQREKSIKIDGLDKEVCKGLGLALESLYMPDSSLYPERREAYRKLVLGIRYFVDRAFERFENLLPQGPHFTHFESEPEDILFLASSFEALLSINDKLPNADFKQKIRPLLHLTYSKPVEIFWKWVDGFYLLRRQIVQGTQSADPIFRFNENFVVSYVYLGLKLFAYISYYKIFEYRMKVNPQEKDLIPLHMQHIPIEEVVVFFWLEQNLLRKISLIMKQVSEAKGTIEGCLELQILTKLFSKIYQQHYMPTITPNEFSNPYVIFIPTPKEVIKEYVEIILMHANRRIFFEGSYIPLVSFFVPHFLDDLKKRMENVYPH